MLLVRVQYNGRHKIVKVYEEWDLDGETVVDIATCTKDDVGKLVRFTDGSGWHVRLKGCSDIAIKTEAGTYRRGDIVQCSRIKWPGGNYSGVPASNEHKLVRWYTRREKALATRMLNGTLNGKKTNPRIRMLALEKLQEAADRHGITEDWVVGKLVAMADNPNGRHAFNAVGALSRMKGHEINQQQIKEVSKPIGLFQQNNIITIQERRRQGIPAANEISNMIPQNVRGGMVSIDDDECAASVSQGPVQLLSRRSSESASSAG